MRGITGQVFSLCLSLLLFFACCTYLASGHSTRDGAEQYYQIWSLLTDVFTFEAERGLPISESMGPDISAWNFNSNSNHVSLRVGCSGKCGPNEADAQRLKIL